MPFFMYDAFALSGHCDVVLLEYREVDAAVAPVLHEAWMVGEVVVLAMLEHEDTVLVQQVAVQYEVWNLGELLQCVRWVGEDEVELLLATLQEAEHVATNQDVLVLAQLLEALADEVGMVTVCLHAYYSAAATGYQLERDAARAGEEVEG